MMKVFGWLLPFLVLGCVSKPLKKPTGLGVEDFWEEQSNRTKELSSWEAKAHLLFEEKGKSVSGKGKILFLTPDTIRLEIKDPFGRLHFAATKKNRAFTSYFVYQKIAFLENENGREYLKQKMGIALPFDEVLGLWLGKLPAHIQKAKFKDWEWDDSDATYVGTIDTGKEKITCHVDGDLGVLKKLEWKDSSHPFEIVYDDLGPCCNDKKNSSGLSLAYSAKFEGLNEHTRVEVEWDDIQVNPKPTQPIDVQLPKDTEKVLLKP